MCMYVSAYTSVSLSAYMHGCVYLASFFLNGVSHCLCAYIWTLSLSLCMCVCVCACNY